MTTTNQDQAAYTIQEFAQTYKVGRTTVFEEIAAGRLRSYKIGRSRRISGEAGREWQRALEQASQQDAGCAAEA